MSKRGENIYKRKDNRWEARYIKEYRADGSAKFGYCYGKTYKEAKQKVVNARTALYLGNSPKVDKLDKSFDSFCDEWILLKRNKVTESTLIKYSNTIKNHIKPHFNNCQLSYFSTQSISNFCDHLVRDKKLASKTVKDILNVLNAILKHIRKEIPTLFANTEITYPKRTKKEIRILSLCEQKSLMTFLLKETDNFKLATALALMTGLRIGEICALRWGDISLEEKTLKVKYTMQRLQNFENNTLKKTKIVITEPKSPTSLRTIPLTDFATELCKKHYVSNPEAFLLTSKPDKFV
ncbi:MAG: tyrosine-type recombinase/integrase family protein, partial [Clostridia bacterium]|nr:tyrosine-type recombinase/integrase family protein [Clostridia bacterium]